MLSFSYTNISDETKKVCERLMAEFKMMPKLDCEKSDDNFFRLCIYDANIKEYRAPLKTPSEKKQLCTASAASSPLVVRKHAFDGFSCIYCTYLLFLTQNGFLVVPYNEKEIYEAMDKLFYQMKGYEEFICYKFHEGKI